MGDREPSRVFPNVRECSRMFVNVPEWMFWNVREVQGEKRCSPLPRRGAGSGSSLFNCTIIVPRPTPSGLRLTATRGSFGGESRLTYQYLHKRLGPHSPVGNVPLGLWARVILLLDT